MTKKELTDLVLYYFPYLVIVYVLYIHGKYGRASKRKNMSYLIYLTVMCIAVPIGKILQILNYKGNVENPSNKK